MSRWGWAPYVPVAQRRANALKKIEKMRKQGKNIQPVELNSRTIARSFWGKGWCEHLESFSDYDNRLPRGRTYVRNGSVCHLEVSKGEIKAMVSGSSMYNVTINIHELEPKKWKKIKNQCTGQIGSILELLKGKLSEEVMTVVSDRNNGLFPLPGEIELNCSCPDWATMCKHVAAVLYGVGHRLDAEPDLLFTLRGVDAQELITAPISLTDKESDAQADTLEDGVLADVFGIDMDLGDSGRLSAPSDSSSGAFGADKKQKIVKKGRSAKSKGAVSARQAAKPVKKKTAKTAPKSKSVSGTKSKVKAKIKAFNPTGVNIRKLRAKSGLSGAEFARRIGSSPATIYRWEKTKGKCTVHSRLLAALNDFQADLYNI